MIICDFCSIRTEEFREYIPLQPVTEVRMADVHAPVRDVGPWCACPECEKLIETDNWKELSERALAAFHKMEPDAPRDLHNQACESMWRMVFGERVKIGKEVS